MTEINPYSQGFRDALLTVRAAIVNARHDHPAAQGYPDEDTYALQQIEAALDAQLAKSDHDLWNVLALAQVDLSAHPEAQALRAMLRAPTGVLIDGDGRMLFLRLNGTEYDTGVLRLKEQVEALNAAADPKPIEFTVNGRTCLGAHGTVIPYEQICALAVGVTVTAPRLTVTFRGKGELGEFSGTLVAGASVVLSDGMVFNVALTG